MADAFEILEDPATGAQFCFAHAGSDFTTGVLVMKADSELPKHHRPHAEENLLQLSGHSQVTLLDEAGNVQSTHDLTPGTTLHMKKGQWHIHANPYGEPSLTQFKAEGDISEIVAGMRHKFTKVTPDDAPAQV